MRPFVAILFVCWIAAVPGRSQGPAVDSLQQQLSRARHDSTRLRVSVALAFYHFNRNQFDSVYIYVRRGFQWLQKSPANAYASDLYYLLARYNRFQSQYQEGIRPAQQAIRYAQLAHDARRTAECQYTLAVILSDAGEFERAVDQITVNMAFLNHHNDTPALGANYMLLISLYEELNNQTMQARYQRRYDALDKHNWPPVDRMYAALLTGDALSKKGRLTEAARQYDQALRWARQTNSPLRVVEVLQTQSINFRQRHQYQPAIQVLRQAISIVRPLRAVASMAGLKSELATTYLAAHRPAEALTQARDALKLARQNNQRDITLLTLRSLSDALEANGMYREALTVYREHEVLKEAKFTENSARQVARMQARLDLIAKENTIRILQKTAQISQLNRAHQQQQLDLARRTQWAAIIIIGLLLVLLGVIAYFLRKAHRNYALLTQQQQLLQRTARELTATNAVKDKLFSTISHDLRSPVARMKTTVRQLWEASQLTPPLSPLVSRLEKQVDNVLALLTNLLDWSMIQLKGFHLLLQPIVLHEIVAETVSQASELIEQKQLIVIDQVDEVIVALADKHQLRSVVRNILSNAIKFSQPGGYIRIRATQHDHYIELHVHDTGLGMSDQQLTVLFTSPEVRTGTWGESGVGLGLRICREMMDHQQGKLFVESRPGKGTLVRIRLSRIDSTGPCSSVGVEERHQALQPGAE